MLRAKAKNTGPSGEAQARGARRAAVRIAQRAGKIRRPGDGCRGGKRRILRHSGNAECAKNPAVVYSQGLLLRHPRLWAGNRAASCPLWRTQGVSFNHRRQRPWVHPVFPAIADTAVCRVHPHTSHERGLNENRTPSSARLPQGPLGASRNGSAVSLANPFSIMLSRFTCWIFPDTLSDIAILPSTSPFPHLTAYFRGFYAN